MCAKAEFQEVPASWRSRVPGSDEIDFREYRENTKGGRVVVVAAFSF
jgi:hypothetical protein